MNFPDQSTPPENTPWQPRFGIGGLMLLTFIVCVMASGGYYAVKALNGEHNSKLAFILFAVASPAILLTIIAVATRLLDRRN